MDSFQSGTRNLFAALSGGGDIEARARSRQELANLEVGKGQADFAKKVEEARMATGKRVAREGLSEGLRQALPEGMRDRADGLANIALGFGTNANDIGGMIQGVQKTIIRDEIAPAYEADGVGKGAALAAALGGTALKTNQVQGGYQMNPYDTAGGIVATPTAMADISRKERVADAQIANYQEVSGSGGSGRKPPAPPAYTSPANVALVAAFGGTDGTLDPVKSNQFRTWQLKNAEVDPQYRDGDYALAAYKAGKNAQRTIDYEGKQYGIPADVDPEKWAQATTMVADLKAAGVPATADTAKSILGALSGGYDVSVAGDGKVTWIPGDSPVVAKPTPPVAKAPADRAKGNAGPVAAGVQPPVPGARRSPKDGNWYIPDPKRPGKYIRVDG